MAERINPAEIEKAVASYNYNPSRPWADTDIKFAEGYLDSGNDPFVLLINGGLVLHVYKDGIAFLRQLNFYKDVTNTAAKKKRTISLDGGEYSVAVNPIHKIIACEKSGNLCSVSTFIPGPRLMELSYEITGRLDVALGQLDWELNKELKVTGIELCPGNIKIRTFVEPQALVITDLCGFVTNLRRN